MNIAITGGAGFIGSHLAEKLISEGHEVLIIDNLSSGKKQNTPEEAELHQLDLKEDSLEDVLSDIETVFHFAANPKVNTFPEDREKDFNDNLKATKNLLNSSIDAGVDELVFASSSVVYGEDTEIPTPETANFDPISMYAATKSGAEHMCQVYSQIMDLDLTIIRYANILGGRNPKGVTYDFVNKLRDNPEKLVILGNGRQRKSYLHIEDAIEATMTAWRADQTVYNVGSEDAIDVTSIADIVADEMVLDPEYEYTGGEKGWDGDVPEMRLDISKLKKEGWKPSTNSEESIRKTVKELV